MVFYTILLFKVLGQAVLPAIVLMVPAYFYLKNKKNADRKQLIYTFLFILYCMMLLIYTLEGTKSVELSQWCTEHGLKARLDLSYSYQHYVDSGLYTEPLPTFLTSYAVWQSLGNILLFIPLSIFIMRLFKQRAWTTLLIGIGISSFIEIMQGTGNFGLAPCVYRQADVEDLITNTMGTIIGIIISLILARKAKGKLSNEDEK
ncbi:MAG: VanZ family protein [Micrococcaceae bacterium]